ncbi:hypothetical protein B0H17DRAFT_1130009 [Mycena rosella]|uniref:Uncharacterized protein n=1 Tax=Mycena rosella TaxID=1033263 RepID=A0AAD7DSL4_MYCRO|nr:hypothetical protein B0H17DRAFT_1130009 [Mycena rosella]
MANDRDSDSESEASPRAQLRAAQLTSLDLEAQVARLKMQLAHAREDTVRVRIERGEARTQLAEVRGKYDVLKRWAAAKDSSRSPVHQSPSSPIVPVPALGASKFPGSGFLQSDTELAPSLSFSAAAADRDPRKRIKLDPMLNPAPNNPPTTQPPVCVSLTPVSPDWTSFPVASTLPPRPSPPAPAPPPTKFSASAPVTRFTEREERDARYVPDPVGASQPARFDPPRERPDAGYSYAKRRNSNSRSRNGSRSGSPNPPRRNSVLQSGGAAPVAAPLRRAPGPPDSSWRVGLSHSEDFVNSGRGARIKYTLEPAFPTSRNILLVPYECFGLERTNVTGFEITNYLNIRRRTAWIPAVTELIAVKSGALPAAQVSVRKRPPTEGPELFFPRRTHGPPCTPLPPPTHASTQLDAAQRHRSVAHLRSLDVLLRRRQQLALCARLPRAADARDWWHGPLGYCFPV